MRNALLRVDGRWWIVERDVRWQNLLRGVGRWVAVDLGLFSFSFLGWVTYGEVVQFSLV